MEKQEIINKALELLFEANKNGISNYKIAKETKITEATIGNYINKITKPSFANAKILISYFETDWLKTGKDKMLKKDIGNNSNIYKEKYYQSLEKICDLQKEIIDLKDKIIDYEKKYAGMNSDVLAVQKAG